MWMMIVTLKIYMLKIPVADSRREGVGISDANILELIHIWLRPWKKGSYGKLFTMLFYIHVGTC